MRKLLIWAAILVLAASGIVYYFDLPYTKEISRTVQGVQIQLGAKDNGTKPVSLQLEGTLHRSIRGKLTYKGTILVTGEGLSKNDHGLGFELVKYGKTYYSLLTYDPFEFKDEGFNTFPIFKDPQYFGIFTDEDFSQIMIQVNPQEGSWNNTDGTIIVAPSSDRSDAIARAIAVTHGYSKWSWGDIGDTWLK